MDSNESADQVLFRVLRAEDLTEHERIRHSSALAEHELLMDELKKKYGENLSDRDLLIRYIGDLKRENPS